MLKTPSFYDGKAKHLQIANPRNCIELIEEGIFINKSKTDYILNKKEIFFDFSIENKFLPIDGICDNIQQIKDKYSFWFNHPNLNFCVELKLIKKSEQPSNGGFMWKKEDYIGTKKAKFGYLKDEKSIKQVFLFHIIFLKS